MVKGKNVDVFTGRRKYAPEIGQKQAFFGLRVVLI
jgi:hypothetical protein